MADSIVNPVATPKPTPTPVPTPTPKPTPTPTTEPQEIQDPVDTYVAGPTDDGMDAGDGIGIMKNTAKGAKYGAKLVRGAVGAAEAIEETGESLGKVSKPLQTAGGVATKVAKVAQPVAIAATVGKGAYDVYDAATDPNLTREEKSKEIGGAVGETAGAIGGGIAGAKGGALVGAAIGTLIAPGIGTAIGGAVGAVGGGIAGGFAGSSVGKKTGKFFGGLFGKE